MTTNNVIKDLQDLLDLAYAKEEKKIELPKIVTFDEEYQQEQINSIIADPDMSYLTGMKLYDKLTDDRGAYLRELHILSAPTGVGKTTMLLLIMLSMAKKYPKEKFLYIGFEQSQREIFMKLYCYNNKHPYERFRIGVLPKSRDYIPDNIGFVYGDAPGFRLDSIIKKAKDEGYKFIFYDYIGAVLDPTCDKEWVALENEARKLKNYAIDNDMFILAATQTNNDIEELEKEPKLYNQRFIANSKGIARKADVCMILTRCINKSELEKNNNMRIDCYKNRNGNCPKVAYFKLNHSTGEIRYGK